MSRGRCRESGLAGSVVEGAQTQRGLQQVPEPCACLVHPVFDVLDELLMVGGDELADGSVAGVIERRRLVAIRSNAAAFSATRVGGEHPPESCDGDLQVVDRVVSDGGMRGAVRVEGFQALLDVLLDVLTDLLAVVRLAALFGRLLDEVPQPEPCAVPQFDAALGGRDPDRCRVPGREPRRLRLAC